MARGRPASVAKAGMDISFSPMPTAAIRPSTRLRRTAATRSGPSQWRAAAGSTSPQRCSAPERVNSGTPMAVHAAASATA